MSWLREGLARIVGEVEFQRTQPLLAGDRFLSVAREFLAQATPRLERLEKQFAEMKWKVRTKRQELDHGAHDA